MGLQTFDESYPVVQCTSIAAASGTAEVTVQPTTISPWRVDKMLVSSTAAVDHTLTVKYNNGTNTFPVIAVNIPAGAGGLGIAPVDVIAALPATMGGIVGLPSQYLRVQLAVTLSGAETMSVFLQGGTV